MCRNPLTALMLIASPFLASLATAQSAATNETVVSQDVRVIDGTGEPPLEHATIVIEGPRIVSVGPANKLHWPKSARLINYSGKTVLPGLISDHSHVGQVDGVKLGAQNYNRPNILRQLLQYEAYGVTTVTALGLNGVLFYALRAQLHSGALPQADLFGADRGNWHSKRRTAGSSLYFASNPVVSSDHARGGSPGRRRDGGSEARLHESLD